MTQLKQIYKCNVCGNIVEVLHVGAGELVCCGQPMELKEEKTEEEGLTEKHLPVIEKTENGILVKIGSTLHPMEKEHYIEWIELNTENGSIKKFLNPEDEPMAVFEMNGENFSARVYCNVHGLWKSA